ncbi:MAG: hypothetical protein KGJ03_05040 [Betaproteobacteria bacterium]|nr:hypothetical protein [Betaproteobacteria bacterium]
MQWMRLRHGAERVPAQAELAGLERVLRGSPLFQEQWQTDIYVPLA